VGKKATHKETKSLNYSGGKDKKPPKNKERIASHKTFVIIEKQGNNIQV